MSSPGDDSEALKNLQRELRAIQQQSNDSTPTDSGSDEPPVAELEALAQTLSSLKSAGRVSFDRKRTWETIEERLAAEPATPGDEPSDSDSVDPTEAGH